MVVQAQPSEHRILLEDRRSLVISGVQSIVSFDENTVQCVTAKGELTVRGSDLFMEQLSVQSGDIHVQGQIDSLEYKAERSKSGWKQRLFGEI